MSLDCFCDYDPPSVWRKRDVKAARKEHRCEECSRTIRAGEPYEYVWGIWDGYRDTFHTCSHCLDLRMFVKNNVPCFCWAHGNLLEDCTETIQAAYDEASEEVRGLWVGFARLLIKAKRARQLA